MKPDSKQIIVSPIGDIPSEVLGPICREVERIFGFPTGTELLLDDIKFAHDEGRDQYHSTAILERLFEAAPVSAEKVLAVTKEDLFIPILTHVYGEAQLGGKSSIISTCRLNEALPPIRTGDLFLKRVLKEAVHELGHTFKLLHCKDKTCIMHYCRSIQDVDRRTIWGQSLYVHLFWIVNIIGLSPLSLFSKISTSSANT